MRRRVFSITFLIFIWLTVLAAQPNEPCYPTSCVDEADNTMFYFSTCCENECCSRLRYWVYPASIAAVGFVAGAFFALCFQCR